MSVEYSERRDEHGEALECECCRYPAPLGEFRRYLPADSEEPHLFCEICAKTFLSHAMTYPTLYGEQYVLFSSLGWIANRLLAEIRKP